MPVFVCLDILNLCSGFGESFWERRCLINQEASTGLCGNDGPGWVSRSWGGGRAPRLCRVPSWLCSQKSGSCVQAEGVRGASLLRTSADANTPTPFLARGDHREGGACDPYMMARAGLSQSWSHYSSHESCQLGPGHPPPPAPTRKGPTSPHTQERGPGPGAVL